MILLQIIIFRIYTNLIIVISYKNFGHDFKDGILGIFLSFLSLPLVAQKLYYTFFIVFNICLFHLIPQVVKKENEYHNQIIENLLYNLKITSILHHRSIIFLYFNACISYLYCRLFLCLFMRCFHAFVIILNTLISKP